MLFAERCAQEGWLKLNEAADVLGVSPRTLRLAIERGQVAGEHPLPDGPWIINRKDLVDLPGQLVAQRASQRSRNPAKPDSRQKIIGFSGT